MLSKLRSRRPTHTTVAAYLALFLALGGGAAYAANTIGSGDVVDNTLKSRDLKDNAGVRSNDVVNDVVPGGGLVGADIRPDALTSSDVSALTGADVTNESLKGDDIDESTLGKVPDAEAIDGKDSSAFVEQNEKAADAEKLDGRDSTEFMQGPGTALRGATAITPGSFPTVLETPHFRVAYSCPTADITTNNGILRVRNLANQEINLFSDNGGVNPNHYGALVMGGAFDQAAAAGGEFVTFGYQGAPVATITVFSVHRASDNRCHVQAQAVTTG